MNKGLNPIARFNAGIAVSDDDLPGSPPNGNYHSIAGHVVG